MTQESSITTTSLITFPDVAAGIINAVYANGSPFVRAEELQDAPLRGAYNATGRLRRLERDVAKFFIRNGRRECVFAFELQSFVDSTMPLRIFGYDGVMYRDQLANEALARYYELTDATIAPIFTVVLYFGEEPWNKSRNLSECVKMSPEVDAIMRKHIEDYRVKVIDFAGMTLEEIQKFPGDVQVIAQYYRCLRLKIEYAVPSVEFTHTKELFFFMEHVAQNSKFAYDVVMRGYKEEPKNMVDLLARWEENARIEERKKFAEERERFDEERERFDEERKRFDEERENTAAKLKQIAISLQQEGRSDEMIANLMGMDLVDVKIWLAEAEENA